MAFDRQGTGLTVMRVCIGVFFISEGISKWRWLLDGSMLSLQLAGWHQSAAAGSVSQWYLNQVAIPYMTVFARLVPIGEFGTGLAMLVGFWTPAAAALAFLMTLNFHIASGVITKLSFLTNGYALPVLGSTLALAIGGVRLRWSLR